jgi:hypothetical protein
LRESVSTILNFGAQVPVWGTLAKLVSPPFRRAQTPQRIKGASMAFVMTALAEANVVMLQRRTCAALVLWRDVHASSRVSRAILFTGVTT